MLYEFITPSDPITFKANNDKIAFVCAVWLGNGKAGCSRLCDDGEEKSLGTMLAFQKNPEETIRAFLYEDLGSFIDKHKPEIAEAFESFSYGSKADRKTYDDALEAITDPDKLAEFKAQHEDRNRTSMSGWVQSAWDMAKQPKKERQYE